MELSSSTKLSSLIKNNLGELSQTGIGRIISLYLERKEVSFCRLRGKRSSLLSREVGGDLSVFLRWSSLLCHLIGASSQSFPVEDEVQDLFLEARGDPSSLARSEISSVFLTLKTTYQEVKPECSCFGA